MCKQVFVINGTGGAGKDTFVKLVSGYVPSINFSSIDRIKEIARQIGWTGTKTEKDRKFLSDLKQLAADFCDMPFKSLEKEVEEFYGNSNKDKFLFLHIREPQEIKRAVHKFNAKTILITREAAGVIISNKSDRDVFNYVYDFLIENNGTLEELGKKAEEFTRLFL